MTDFLICYPSEAALDAVAQQISGLWVPTTTDANGAIISGHVGNVKGMPGVGEWALSDPFQWYKPTGATTTDAFENTVPVQASDGYTYRIFRWSAPIAALAPYITLGGATMTTTVDPDTGAVSILIMAGPVKMMSPLPDDVPVRF